MVEDWRRILISHSVFVGLTFVSGFFAHKLFLNGMLIALWLIPLSFVPVLFFQLMFFLLPGCFAISLGFLGRDWVETTFFSTQSEYSEVWRAMLQGSVLVLSFVGSFLFFWNIFAMLCAIWLLWFGRHRVWRGLGLLSVCWNTLVQFYIYFVYL